MGSMPPQKPNIATVWRYFALKKIQFGKIHANMVTCQLRIFSK